MTGDTTTRVADGTISEYRMRVAIDPVEGEMVPTASGRPTEEGQVIVERPPPGLARGVYGWPAWGIALLGGTLVAFGVVFLLLQLRRTVRTRT